MANPIALPGTNVPSGAAVSPGGAQGPSAVSANANNKATLGSDSLVLVQGTAAGVAATTHAQTVSGDDPQLTNARTPTAHEASHVTGSDQIPLASSSTRGLMNQTSGNTTDFIDGTNNSQALQPAIWSVRLRSFNSLGNSTFEVDQRNVGNAVANPAAGTMIVDRWQKAGNGTYQVNCQQIPSGAGLVLPGTNYRISAQCFRVQLTTVQATLGTNDKLSIRTQIEGQRMRELINDVHSVSLIVNSSVAPLSFSLALYDPGLAHSLVKLCTISTANLWTLIQLPNIAVWSAAGNWSVLPGAVGYDLEICLAAGSGWTAPAADTWQNALFTGAPGMSNFCGQAVNSTFFLAFAQHEPGALCTTLQDCPFQQNLDDCLRYYTKSYHYGTVAATPSTGAGSAIFPAFAGNQPYCWQPFKKVMAKIPTVTSYSPTTGAINTMRDVTPGGVDRAVTAAVNVGDTGFSGFNITGANAANWIAQFNWTADTGW
jgi:hypothetical protein